MTSHQQTQPKEMVLLSLMDAAALKVTKNLNLTLYAVKVIPHNLFPVLLAASLETGLAVSTKAIVQAWPFASLNFSALQRFSKIPGLRNSDELDDHPALAAAMAISEQRDSRIQDIDITSLNLRDRTSTLFLDTLLKGRSAEGKRSKKNTCIRVCPANKELRILMNTTVCGARGEVKAFLKRKRDLLVANIHVRNKLLRVDHCGTDLVEVVLKVVDKERTTELDLGYNCFGNDGLKKILDLIPQFPSLTTLCLQYNTVGPPDEHYDSAVSKLAMTLRNLPNLVHLNLSHSQFSIKLAELLGSMEHTLSDLDLQNCKISREDIEYLARSHHAKGLKQLNLKGNRLGPNWNPLKELFENFANNLVELDLESCDLYRAQNAAVQLARLAPRFSCLRKLNIKYNILRPEDQVDLVVAYRNCSSMLELHLSTPIEIEVEGWIEVCRNRLAEVQKPHLQDRVMMVDIWFEYCQIGIFPI